MATAKRKAVRRASGKPGGRADVSARRPDVILDVDCERGLLFLVLRNIGADLACRVSVDFSPKLVGLGGDRVVSNAPIFRRLAYLPPEKTIRILLDAAHLLFARQQKSAFRARVRYRNRSGDEFSESFAHDLDIYRDLPEIARAPLRAAFDTP